MKLELFYLLILAVGLISLGQSFAVNIGGEHPHLTPISLSTLASSPPISLSRESTDNFAVQYEPKGFHIMAYQIGMFADPSLMWNQGTSRYYFGKDFQLGMIDSN